MKEKLRQAVSIAENKQIEADMALGKVYDLIKFVGFEEDDEPTNISMCSENEIILEWHGKECPANVFVQAMETEGYVSPECFY